MQSSGKRFLPVWAIIILDIIAIGLALCVFSYFHHVRSVDMSGSGVSVLSTDWLEGESSGGGADGSGESLDGSGEESFGELSGASSEGSPDTGDGSESEETSEEVVYAPGDFTAVFETAQEDGDAYLSYAGENAVVNVYKVESEINGALCYYVADIYIRHISNFQTAFAYEKYGQSINDDTLKMAKENGAIVAINGDYYGIHRRGLVIRNGILYRDSVNDDVCVLFADGTMRTYFKEEFDIDEVLAAGAYQAWEFGPALLSEGEAIEAFSGNGDIDGTNPRTAIGYYEPGHYCFVVADGRQSGYSYGLSLEQLSAIFAELGCEAAYNLDGGQTSVMTFGDELANIPYKGGRDVSDIIFIAE